MKKDKVKFRSSFKDQRNITVLLNGSIDIDKVLSITLKPQEVIVLEGVCAAGKQKEEKEEADDASTDKKKGKKKSKKKKSSK